MSAINTLYVFTSRADLATTLKNGAKAVGITEVKVFDTESSEALINELKSREDAGLIVDWQGNKQECLNLLESTRRDQKVDLRPTLIMANSMSAQLVALSGEFGVSSVHIGEISPNTCQILLRELLDNANSFSASKSVLVEVANLRLSDRWEQATSLLEESLRSDPTNKRMATELAENFIRAGRWQDAINTLEDFTRPEQIDVRALHLMGRCYMKLRRHDEALRYLSQAKLMSPLNIDRLIEMGQVLLKLDEVEQAREVFEEALDLDPDNKQGTQGKGQCMLLQGEVNEGLALIQNVSDSRELASIFNTTAVMCVHRNEHSKALKLYDTAIAAVRNDRMTLSRIYYNKGIGYFRWNRADDAQKCFEKAVELDADFIDAIHNLKVLASRKSGQQMVRRTGTDNLAPERANDINLLDSSMSEFEDKFKEALRDEDESFF